MKFYFCEGCGQRITENDIGDGEARDKKLKGVYCKTCAVGITTMDSLPMSDSDAKRLLATNRTKAEQLDRPRRRSSGNVQRAADRPSKRGSSRRIQPAETPATYPKALLVIGPCCVVLALLIIWMVSSSATPTATGDVAKEKKTVKRVDGMEAPARVETASVPVPAPGPAPKAEKPEPPPATPALDLPKTSAKKPNDGDVSTKKDGTPEEFVPSTPSSSAPGATPEAVIPETPTSVPKQEPETKAASPAKPPSQKPLLRVEDILKWILEGDTPGELKARLEKSIPDSFSGKADAVAPVAALIDRAVRVESVLREALAERKGKRLLLGLPDGRKRFFRIEGVSSEGPMIKTTGGVKPLAWSNFSLRTLKKLLGPRLGDEPDASCVAWLVLRGEPKHAEACLDRLKGDASKAYAGILKVRLARAREASAEADLKRFRERVKAEDWGGAKELGETIRERHAGTRALAGLKPRFEDQLADVTGMLIGMKGLFPCDAKRLPGGLVEVNVDPRKHKKVAFDGYGQGLAARWLNFKAEFHYASEDAYGFIIGTSVIDCKSGGYLYCMHGGRKHRLPTRNRESGFTRYRLSAGPKGLEFQVDDRPPKVYPGAWKGGRLGWPWHKGRLQTVRIVGRLDPLWVNEMAEVAGQRVRFERGEWVRIEPRERRVPAPEAKPRLIGRTKRSDYNYDVDTHRLAGWHQVGASWGVDGKELVSPRPPADRKTWYSLIRPLALIACDAELVFEARIDEGEFNVLLPGYHTWYYEEEYLIVGTDELKIDAITPRNMDGSRSPGTYNQKVQVTRPRAPCKGKWRKYLIRKRGGIVEVAAEGAAALVHKAKLFRNRPLNICAFRGSHVRVRNVKIRKLGP